MSKFLWLIPCLLFSASSVAEIRLYACTQDGVALLQDKPIEGCDDMQTFTYQSTYKGDKSFNLSKEQNQLIEQEQARLELERERYIQVDEAVGDSLTVRERDRRYDRCYFFKNRIDQNFVLIERRPEDHLDVRHAVAQIVRDAQQHKYYCNQSYPNIKQKLYPYRYKARSDIP